MITSVRSYTEARPLGMVGLRRPGVVNRNVEKLRSGKVILCDKTSVITTVGVKRRSSNGPIDRNEQKRFSME